MLRINFKEVGHTFLTSFTALQLNVISCPPYPGSIMNKIRSIFTKPENGVTFQILSDLHLEVCEQYSSFDINPSADYLVLAGDIGRLVDYELLLQFLFVQTTRFKLVFLVLGNHEFYGTSFITGIESAKRLEKEISLEGKLILLQKRRYDIPDSTITILGCTLWSKIPGEKRI